MDVRSNVQCICYLEFSSNWNWSRIPQGNFPLDIEKFHFTKDYLELFEMKNRFILGLFAILLAELAESGKLLLVPGSAASHVILFASAAKPLQENGHEVHMTMDAGVFKFVPDYVKKFGKTFKSYSTGVRMDGDAEFLEMRIRSEIQNMVRPTDTSSQPLQ